MPEGIFVIVGRLDFRPTLEVCWAHSGVAQPRQFDVDGMATAALKTRNGPSKPHILVGRQMIGGALPESWYPAYAPGELEHWARHTRPIMAASHLCRRQRALLLPGYKSILETVKISEKNECDWIPSAPKPNKAWLAHHQLPTMDKCWFVLNQVHYYPAPDDCIKQGIPDAPLCLGHLVPSLRHLDHVINASEFLPFEKRMKPSRPTTRHDFVWNHEAEREVGVLAKASVPLAGVVPGVDATATVGALFSKQVSNYRQFGALEQWITSPTRAYINKCLRTEEVQDHIKRVSAVPGWWTMYMITGLAIARGVKRMETSESKGVTLVQGVGCQVPLVAEVGPEVTFARREHSTITESETTDFVWAVRLAKITKNGLQRDWSIETVFGKASILGRRATFSADSTEPDFDPTPMLAAERLGDSEYEVTTVNGNMEEEHFITILDEDEKKEECLDSLMVSESILKGSKGGIQLRVG